MSSILANPDRSGILKLGAGVFSNAPILSIKDANPCSNSLACEFLKSATSASYWSVALLKESFASFLKLIDLSKSGKFSKPVIAIS